MGKVDGIVSGYNEVIEIGLSNGEVMGTTLVDAYGFKLWSKEVSDLVSSYSLFGGLLLWQPRCFRTSRY